MKRGESSKDQRRGRREKIKRGNMSKCAIQEPVMTKKTGDEKRMLKAGEELLKDKKLT